MIDIATATRLTTDVAWKGTKNEVNACNCARRFETWCGPGAALDVVDTSLLDDYVEYLKDLSLAPATINRHLAAVSKMLSVCLERGHIDRKPHIPRQRESQGRLRWLTREEEVEVLRLADPRLADLIMVLLDTGLRLGEALRLEARDVNFDTSMVTAWETKNGSSRSVPMTKRVTRVLAVCQDWPPAARPFPERPHFYQHLWNRVRTEMGLWDDPQFVLHCLRHTFGSRLVQRGVDMRTVQQLMGHKSLNVTMRYVHLADENLTNAVSLLEDDNA